MAVQSPGPIAMQPASRLPSAAERVSSHSRTSARCSTIARVAFHITILVLGIIALTMAIMFCQGALLAYIVPSIMTTILGGVLLVSDAMRVMKNERMRQLAKAIASSTSSFAFGAGGAFVVIGATATAPVVSTAATMAALSFNLSTAALLSIPAREAIQSVYKSCLKCCGLASKQAPQQRHIRSSRGLDDNLRPGSVPFPRCYSDLSLLRELTPVPVSDPNLLPTLVFWDPRALNNSNENNCDDDQNSPRSGSSASLELRELFASPSTPSTPTPEPTLSSPDVHNQATPNPQTPSIDPLLGIVPTVQPLSPTLNSSPLSSSSAASSKIEDTQQTGSSTDKHPNEDSQQTEQDKEQDQDENSQNDDQQKDDHQ